LLQKIKGEQMLKKHIMISTLTLILVGFSGCSVKTGNTNLENMSQSHIQKVIIKGKTTQNEIRGRFGEPSSTSILPTGEQSWMYMFAKARSGFFSGTSRGRTLIIMFDKNGIVKNYTFSSSNNNKTSIGF
jgi:outer membrane protein assembly factor BamE (lipoprotein component of BamABCDE complex)